MNENIVDCGVLPDADIKRLSEEVRLIDPFDEKALQPASYDLRIGDEYMHQGVIHGFESSGTQSVVVRPGEFLILTSHEKINVPQDMVGHCGLTSVWCRRGLIPLNSPQIDPGFQGIISIPVFNAGDFNVTIRFQEEMFTIEFLKMQKKASYGWSEKYGIREHLESAGQLLEVRSMFKRLQQVERGFEDIGKDIVRVDQAIDHVKGLLNGFVYATVAGVVAGIVVSIMLFLFN